MGDKIVADSTEFSQMQLVIGRNRLGQWIVADFRRGEGWIFNNRQDALNFAMFPRGAQPRAVLFVPDVLEVR